MATVQAVKLPDGRVLVTGGGGPNSSIASEIYAPNTGQWITVAPLPDPKINFGLARVQSGRVIAFGGSINTSLTEENGTASSYIFTSPFTSAAIAALTSPAPGKPIACYLVKRI